MNKKLLTAAIGAALAAGPMLAQADVKLYGKVHMSVDSVNPGDKGAGAGAGTNSASERKSTQVSSNASRWGIDVSEKLGGGLTAIAKLEQDIAADGDNNSQNARNRYVGLKGKFGQLIAGTHDTPFKEISRTVELFPEYIGDNRNLVSTGASGGLGWDLRPANMVRYDSPSLNGFVASYLFSADTTAVTGTEDNRRRADSVGVKYSKGPLYAAFAYEAHRLASVADTGNPTEKGYRLGGSYNFGAFKAVAMYQDLKDLGGVTSGGSTIKRKAWVLGGAYTPATTCSSCSMPRRMHAATPRPATALSIPAPRCGRSVGTICSRRPPRCTWPMPRPTTRPARTSRSTVRRQVCTATPSPRSQAAVLPPGRSV